MFIFPDMVEPEFYEMGKKKKRKLKKECAEAKKKAEEEEDQEGSSKDEDSEEGDSDEDKSENASSDEDTKEQVVDKLSDGVESTGASLSNNSDASKKTANEKDSDTNPPKVVEPKKPKVIRTTPAAVDVDDKSVKTHKPKSNFFASGDADDDLEQDEGISSGDDKMTSQNLAEDFKGFASELKSNESIKDFLKSRTAEGKKTLDSVFMGSLSDRKPASGGAEYKKKNRAGQRERQR